MNNDLNFLSTRSGFNQALKHFKTVNAFISACEKYYNLADVLNNALNSNQIKAFQIPAIVNVLLVDKFKYYFESFNIKSNYTEKTNDIVDEIKDWNAVDIVIVYYHPQLGPTLINPKSPESFEVLSSGIKENELINIYAGFYGKEFDMDTAKQAVKSFIDLLYGKKVKNGSSFKSDVLGFQKPAPLPVSKPAEPQEKAKTVSQQQPVSPAKRKLSPKYGITVANELFHNGNVEAWKKIIESYETKYPEIEVLVFYDNEQINDLNTLFKWGKVKFGTMIFFSLLGEEFKDVSKLRRYLAQGASPKFEAFLKGSPGQVLQLF